MSNNVICCLRYFSFNVTSVYLSSTSLVESKQTKFQLRHKKWVLHLRAIREGNYLGAYHPRPFIDWPKSIASFYTKITIFHMTIFPLLLLWNTFLILTQSNIFRSCLCFIKTRSSFLLVLCTGIIQPRFQDDTFMHCLFYCHGVSKPDVLIAFQHNINNLVQCIQSR